MCQSLTHWTIAHVTMTLTGCINTTWSSFMWRASATVPFALARGANTTLSGSGYAFRLSLPTAADETR